MHLAEAILVGAGTYGAIGVIFATAFVSRGVFVLDQAAIGAPRTFRALIFPGCVALWPVLLTKWLRVRRALTAEPGS